MDERTFTGEGQAEGEERFWLFKDDAHYTVVDARKELGQSQGWTDENWYQDANNLKVLFNELNNNHTALLDRLGEATDDGAQLETLKEVVQAVSPEEEQKEEEHDEHGQPDLNDNSGSSASAGLAPPAAEAPKKPSIFVRKKQADESGDQAVEAAGPEEQAVEAAAGAPAEAPAPAKPSLFARKSPPGGERQSGESDSSESTPTKEELHAELAGFAADSESPLTEEDLKKMVADPDFEKNLAEAEKELEAQLAALLDDGANA